uniref:Putative uncharacterized protein LQK1 n=1 Tax=Homo sapiens TaxID=9606 RepID=LQK1_HUMAN|nr:RecName: Full=Putative uncharacterized protein LQK1; AltName: Full=FLVCR1 antisense RNA 1; AltName: Full=FLVCR1 divergent transcript [Homo sapiens]AAK51141.1 LQK1 hypothetical protein long isoform [Homo sapiens]AAK51142.1 LQK1 hypothetical protein short isoform [Homo sapiens]
MARGLLHLRVGGRRPRGLCCWKKGSRSRPQERVLGSTSGKNWRRVTERSEGSKFIGIYSVRECKSSDCRRRNSRPSVVSLLRGSCEEL